MLKTNVFFFDLLMLAVMIPIANATTVPDSPPYLSSMAGNQQVSLKWLAPTNDGGSPITHYLIEYSDSNKEWKIFKTKLSTLTSGTVTNLTNYETYSFRVSAVNDIGTSEPSSVIIETPGKSKY